MTDHAPRGRDLTEHACARCEIMCPVHSTLCAACEDMVRTGIGEPEEIERAVVDAVYEEPVAEVLPAGTMIDVYRIQALLGAGGVGIVYEAAHTTLGRKVAFKVLRPEFSSTPKVVRRFFAEARAANRIAHANIVEVTDFREHPEIGAYLIMELLQGEDLAEILYGTEGLPLKRALPIARQVASALAAAHDAGIVHRDMKPDNVFVCRNRAETDFVKLLDFGVAKLAETTELDAFNTAAGTLLGTPAYMSPEQALGQPVDHRTDIYAFGVILFELLTGRLPFDAETAGEFIVLHATTEPKRLSDVRGGFPRALSQLVSQCLAKDTADRPASMREVETALHAISESPAPEDVEPATPPRRDEPTVRILSDPERTTARSKLPWIAAAAAVAVVGVGALLFSVTGGEPEARARPVPPAAEPPSVVEAAPPPPEPEVEPGPEADPPALAEPEPPAEIAVIVRTRPAGAEVWREGADEPLGTTPLTTTILASEGTGTFELRRDGYRTHREELSLSHDIQLTVGLRRQRRRPAPASPAPPPRPAPTGRRGVISF